MTLPLSQQFLEDGKDMYIRAIDMFHGGFEGFAEKGNLTYTEIQEEEQETLIGQPIVPVCKVLLENFGGSALEPAAGRIARSTKGTDLTTPVLTEARILVLGTFVVKSARRSQKVCALTSAAVSEFVGEKVAPVVLEFVFHSRYAAHVPAPHLISTAEELFQPEPYLTFQFSENARYVMAKKNTVGEIFDIWDRTELRVKTVRLENYCNEKLHVTTCAIGNDGRVFFCLARRDPVTLINNTAVVWQHVASIPVEPLREAPLHTLVGNLHTFHKKSKDGFGCRAQLTRVSSIIVTVSMDIVLLELELGKRIRVVRGGTGHPYLKTLNINVTDFIGTRFLQQGNAVYIKVLKDLKVCGMRLYLDDMYLMDIIEHGEQTDTVNQLGLFNSQVVNIDIEKFSELRDVRMLVYTVDEKGNIAQVLYRGKSPNMDADFVDSFYDPWTQSLVYINMMTQTLRSMKIR